MKPKPTTTNIYIAQYFKNQCGLVFRGFLFSCKVFPNLERNCEDKLINRSFSLSVYMWVKMCKVVQSAVLVCMSMTNFLDLLWLFMISQWISSIGILCLYPVCNKIHKHNSKNCKYKTREINSVLLCSVNSEKQQCIKCCHSGMQKETYTKHSVLCFN